MGKFSTGDGWLTGTIEKASGPLLFNIKLQDGRTVRCHIDHILLHPKQMAAPDWLLHCPLLHVDQQEFLYLQIVMDMRPLKLKEKGKECSDL